MHFNGPQSHHKEGSHCLGHSNLNKICCFQVRVTGHLQMIMTSVQVNNPTLKKDPTLGKSKHILVSDNIAGIRSCMVNDQPTHTPHPTLGTAFNLSASGDRYQVISPANITNSWLVCSPPTQLSSFSCKCSISLSGLYHLLVILPVSNWQFPYGVSSWVLSYLLI